MIDKEEISEWFRGLQDRVCTALEAADGGAVFQEDNWVRADGGGGRTRVIQEGKVIEKGGVAFSAVHGPIPGFLKMELEKLSTKSGFGTLDVNHSTFYATGVSIVIHPHNPMVPIIHLNVRYFETNAGLKWFGGGMDLTPHYVNEEDARYFHMHLKTLCDKFNPNYYPDFKQWADDYFFIKHRKETRGVGGIFFDHLTPGPERPVESVFEFVKALGESFAPIYVHFMEHNNSLSYGDAEKQWQSLRRGRYVEFNLVYDKGTRFGLESGGRTESILMSLPKNASWIYNSTPSKGSKEENTLTYLKKGRIWS